MSTRTIGTAGAPGRTVTRGATAPARTRPGGRRAAPVLAPVRPSVGAGGSRPRGAAPTVGVVRRRRAVALALGLAVVLGLVLTVMTSVASGPGGMPGAVGAVGTATTVTVVREGESLQDLARRAAPGTDERVAAEHIRELNDLSTSAVPTGRPLVVPVTALR